MIIMVYRVCIVVDTNVIIALKVVEQIGAKFLACFLRKKSD